MAGPVGKISPFKKQQKNLPKLIIQNRRVDLTRDAERGNLRSLKATVQKALTHSEAFLLQGDATDISKGGELPIARCWAVVRAAVGGHTDVIRYFVENFSDIVSSGTQEACLPGKAPQHLPNCCVQGTRGDQACHRHSPPPIALHWAASTGNADAIKILLGAGASVDWSDELGRTPLHWAAYFRREKAVKCLLSHGARVNATTKHGVTPLMECLKGVPFRSQVETVHCLVQSGVDICVLTAEGETVFHVIAALEWEESRRLLPMLVHSNPQKALPLLLGVPFVARYTLLPALLFAVQEDKVELVEHAVSHFKCDPVLHADALLGLSTRSLEVNRIQKLWERAFRIRCDNKISVEILPRIGTYENREEVTSWEQAKELLGDQPGGSVTDIARNELLYQLAILQERIFGLGNPHVIEFLWSRSSHLCYGGNLRASEHFYLRGLELLLICLSSRRYSVDLCVSTSQPLSEISFMIRCSYIPKFARYVRLYLDALLLISEVASKGNDSQFQREQLAEFCNYLAQTAFLVLCTWAYYSHKHYTSEENESVQLEIAEFGQQLLERASFILCYSLLDVGTKTTEWVKASERVQYKDFILEALLSWAKLAHAFDAMDSNGQRPLHLLLTSMNPDSMLLKLLLENGAHIDAVNLSQKRAIGVFHDHVRPSSLPDMEPLLTPPNLLSLSCLAARAVVAMGIPYQAVDSTPPRIKKLVCLHDPNADRGQFVHTTCFLPPVVRLCLLP